MSEVRVEASGALGARLWIKVVPGSSRDQVAGVLGDRLKVRVSAPPENDRANKAVCATIAKTLGVKAKHVTIESGHTNPEKTVRIEGVSVEAVRARLERSAG
jgi:uncharacterized protein (TIGR00251 family)